MKLSPVDTQVSLALARRSEKREDPPLAVIANYKSRLDAIDRAIQWSDLEDHEVYEYLEIDKAQWSRIMSGNMNFPTQKYHLFNECVGNTILLRYDAYQEGMDVVPLESELQKENRMLKEELKTKVQEMEVIKKFLRETGA